MSSLITKITDIIGAQACVKVLLLDITTQRIQIKL